MDTIQHMNARPTKRGDRWLINRESKEDCLTKLRSENFSRITLSFYKYVYLGTEDEVYDLRDELYLLLDDLGCLGRIYLAQEGINAQMSVPEHQWDAFVSLLYSFPAFNNVPLKIGVEQGESFWKLNVRVKKQIVADGLALGEYNIENVGTHLDAEAFNREMAHPETIVVDMRNAYESEIGHFEGALTPASHTFREEIKEVVETLQGKEDKKVLLYCTGGIRCEKASAYLKSKGFNDVNQLHGGIIAYKHQIEEEGLENKFKGANFVFDGRTREVISDEILGSCATCGNACDFHRNCTHQPCNKLFLQCDTCVEEQLGTCSEHCKVSLHAYV